MTIYKKMKKIKKHATNTDSAFKFLGIRISKDTRYTLIIMGVILLIPTIGRLHYNNVLSHGKTEIVSAKIIDVGIWRRGGLRKHERGYIKVVYFMNGKEIKDTFEDISIRDHIENYQIGDCIELLVSLEDEDIHRWNKSKGTFKCP
jgi:hypothetical protein